LDCLADVELVKEDGLRALLVEVVGGVVDRPRRTNLKVVVLATADQFAPGFVAVPWLVSTELST